jgi:hypothetical protein
MNNLNNNNYRNGNLKINGVEVTTDCLTGRAGLSFFVTYLHGISVFPLIDKLFGGLRKSKKGASAVELFKQVFCFMMDGTSRHLVYFDNLKNDRGYAACIESTEKDMASSHSMKRFFKSFSIFKVFLFRRLLQNLFIWRLKISNPDVIELGIDTMVMDNDDAESRHGVKPTYKKKKGFQPLQMNWERYFVDAVFRGGNKHSNHSDTVQKMIVHMVQRIRKEYRTDVPIILRIDSGFFDQKIFEVCEELGIGYICGGKMYKDIVEFATGTTEWNCFSAPGKADTWEYAEFGSKRDNWKMFRRALYCRLINDGPQLRLPGTRPDTIIITNLGLGGRIDELLKQAGQSSKYLSADAILAGYHVRGSDELANRALKDFGHEQLPFTRFTPNAAWYYMMLVSHFLFEAFKEDAAAPAVSVNAYASTVRRLLIDIAGKIVRHSGRVVLKVAHSSFKSLRLEELLVKCSNPPTLQY